MDCCTNEHQHTNNSHQAHSHGHGMSHGDASSYLRRFWIVTVLLIPLVMAQPKIYEFVGLSGIYTNKWIQFSIATIIFGFALVFFQHAWHEIRARQYGMMTLVAIAVGSGYLFSVASTFIPSLQVAFYLEISTLVWVLLFGHYLEAKSSSAAGDALSEVAKLLPKKAHKIDNNQEIDVDVSTLKEGDVVLVKPGEKVSADGRVVEGEASVDESLISGESKPIAKKKGDQVVAGSICLDGSLTVYINRIGENSTIGQIQELIRQAGQTKPRSQKIADKASAILTFIAIAVALATLLVWTLVMGEAFVFAITLAITVLVIACPHALGLAIPTVTTIATSLAVKNGLFIKDLSKLESIKNVDYVVFDKTGTLTKGEFGVTNVVPLGNNNSNDILSVAASLDQHSSHIIGKSIVEYAKNRGIKMSKVDDFKYIAGQGTKARLNGKEYFVGNAKLIEDLNIKQSLLKDVSGTMALVASRDELLGCIVLSDVIKESSYGAIKDLHNNGIKVAMLTGDNDSVARSVAEELGIDKYFADVLPEDKYRYIKELQDQGNVVLMVGDGVNDAPALTQSDVGVAVGAGTDVAVEAGDAVLTDNNPEDVVLLINLAKKFYSKMIQNLAWALGYNIVAIPAAAGVFAGWGFFLRPEIGALVMSLSTVIVVINALSLRRADLVAS